MTPKIQIARTIPADMQSRWQAIAGDDPFNSYAFLTALETSKSTGVEAGWEPLHILATDGDALLGAAPLWVKSHSYGEYIFDHAFADAYARHDVPYYPKLLAAAPFTPANGLRILSPDPAIREAILDTILGLVEENALSSAHINFALDDAPSEPWIERHNVQYHFTNENYESFDDFLQALSASKRKMIRKERAGAQAHGFEITMKEGAELTPADWDCFWDCYQDTGARKWGTPYLTRAFFDEIAETMQDHIVMGMAYDNNTPVASALNFKDENRLLGRYWGALGEFKFLHYELCYYQAIEYAIAHGIKLVEAGAQGEHKIARGYRPVITKSYHYFKDPQFAHAIAGYIADEKSDLKHYIKRASESLPFKEKPCA